MLTISLILAPMLIAVPVRERPSDGPNTSWVGKTVFIKTSGSRIDLSAEPLENRDPNAGAVANAIQYRVHGERPEHVQVKTREGQSGWLRKADVVLLEDAVAFFTRQIQAYPGDAGTFSRRASAWRSVARL